MSEVSQAQSYGRQVRTYITPPELCQPTVSPFYSSPDDLSTVLKLAKLLDHDCTPPSSSNNIDINTGVIIDKLINALVYTTTHCASCVGSKDDSNKGSYGGSGDRDGLLIGLLTALLGSGGGNSSSGSGANNGNSGSIIHSNGDQGLIDLSLLDRNDLLKLIIGNENILRLGLGSQISESTPSSITSSSSEGALGAVGGLLDTIV